MPTFLQHDGQPVYVQGYCATWNTLSHPAPELGNRRSLFLPGAFSEVLKRPMLSLTCQPHHAGATIGSVRDRTLTVWEDAVGCAFRCGPLSVTSGAVIRSIVAGQTRGASTRATVAEQKIREINGEDVIVISRMKSLLHIAPVDVPMDDATAVWCSHEVPGDMPPRIKALAETWAASWSRHGARKKLRTLARLAPRSQARPPATRCTPVRLATTDIYPPGFGFSSAELEESAFKEDVGRRAHKQARQRKRRAA